MDASSNVPLTQILAAAESGDESARQQLWQAVYEELHRLAKAHMAGERRGRTIQTTVLVHEAYLRLLGPEGREAPWSSRGHFFSAAAEAMRRILVDDARTRRRVKRGGGVRPGPLGPAQEPGVEDPDPAEVLAVDEALAKLEAEAPRQAQVVKLRYFAGLTGKEIAEVLGVGPRTVDADWRLARAWLYRVLAGE